MLTSAVRAPLPSLAVGPMAGGATISDDWLPSIAPRDAELLNALYRSRRPIEATLAGQKITIETAARVAIDADAYAFRMTLFGRPALLRMSAGLVELCARSLSVNGFDRLGVRQAAMLLELALLAPIKALELRLRADIRIESRIDAIETTDALLPLQFRVHGLAGRNAGAELFIERESVPAIASALNELAVPSRGTEQLPLPVQLSIGGSDLTLAELRTVRAGDIILADGDVQPAGASVAVVSERLRFQAERVASGFRLVSRLAAARAAPTRSDSTGVWSMQPATDALQRPGVDEADLEQLPIRVVFELGKLDMPLAEVRRLAPGSVLPMARPSETAVDIVANGRKIGHGSLLKIGDSIGVRVERLFSDE